MEVEAGKREWEVTCSWDDGHANWASEKRLPTPFLCPKEGPLAPVSFLSLSQGTCARPEDL